MAAKITITAGPVTLTAASPVNPFGKVLGDAAGLSDVKPGTRITPVTQRG